MSNEGEDQKKQKNKAHGLSGKKSSSTQLWLCSETHSYLLKPIQHVTCMTVLETKYCKWVLIDLFITSCVTLVSHSLPFGSLRCLVVYLYHISSFIKNSVSGAGERALGSEVDRLLGNHPPRVPSGAPPALLAPHIESQQTRRASKTKGGRTDGGASERGSSKGNKNPSHLILKAQAV